MISSHSVSIGFISKAKAYAELLKMRLSLLVAFSCAFGYGLATHGNVNWITLFMLTLGGLLLSGASVCINQIIEKDLDKVMTRTMHRPLPTGRVSVNEAIAFAVICMALSFIILSVYTNTATVALSFVSMVLYSFVYTPLKRVGPIAVFVGAIPGALPPLLGWIAATGTISHEAMIIFSIQFVWQFPHFWAIAWVADDDYKKAGFKLLPSGGGRDLNTAIQIMVYTMFLIPLGLLPARFGLTGLNSAIVATVCGAAFFSQTFSLMKTGNRKSALRIMFGSFLYLPIVQIAYLLDKI
ncbi:MAG: Heme O synthase, protoheme IX farnesyltransferase, COX10-CtaB [Cytophagales bacterium]|jgi:protoheme IX farnesyltransferase|nr:protoheme IX farnesyltransferase [Bacteroidota bacterium]MBS1981956.1 protoheme IX farnesyltransferase [Bacteroidota bacterium]WHZ09406.1 MAG: Heme O synthase, protoheme IX farnesyltransferase, COX10-CtaB [Cytophagales bacterium]